MRFVSTLRKVSTLPTMKGFIPMNRRLTNALGLSSLILTFLPYRVSCASADGRSSDGNPDSEKKDERKDNTFNFEKILAAELDEKGSLNGIKKFFESGVPGQLGYGFLMGYSSGFCLKKVSKIAAFFLGSSFILVQSLSYSGLIKVDYEGVQKKLETLLDLNKDGKVDFGDVQYAQEKVVEILGYNMPAGGGFAAGLAAGLRA